MEFGNICIYIYIIGNLNVNKYTFIYTTDTFQIIFHSQTCFTLIYSIDLCNFTIQIVIMQGLNGVKAIPWLFGQICVSLSILVTICALIYWLRVERKGTALQLKFMERNVVHNLAVTYFHLITSYTLTIVSVMYVLFVPKLMYIVCKHTLEVIVGVIAVMTALTAIIECIPYSQERHRFKTVVWCVHSLVLGFPIAYFGEYNCTLGLFSTAFLVLLASLVSFIAEKDLYKSFEGHLTPMYYAVIISSAVCLIMNQYNTLISILLLIINLFGGIILYSGVMIVNTQYFINDAITNENYDPIYTSAVVYLCSMNLYIRLALYHSIQNSYCKIPARS